ncbi:MAG: hypothetical protein D6819_00085 [Gammaproteobacteria bacterium]|nr:MAG: hypothetical protein D6819_00085 [Gammaproteobacteria bacterium]
MEDREFHAMNALLERRVGIRYALPQKGFVKSRLQRRMQELGMENLEAYVRYLLAHEDKEWPYLYDHLVIHDSRFFRHGPSFALIQDALLPYWRQIHRPVRVWSVGCATGEEPYSLAMTLYASLKERVHVFGNDISMASLRQAQRGIYPLRKLKDVPWAFKHYLRKAGAGFYQMAPEIRKRIAFFCCNVLHMACVARESMDLIVCQNLLLYFSQGRRRALLDQLTMRLRQGGSLILAPGEVNGWSHPAMARIPYPCTLAFQKNR